jgi:hypothetical protein
MKVLKSIADQKMLSSALDILDDAVFDAYGIPEHDRKEVMACALQC